jgi:mRNA interferase MazF
MSKETWVPDRGQIIWINYNPQSGREMKDMHPMLVLSPKNFNDQTGIVIGLPMTTAEYNNTNPFAVKFKGPKEIISYVLAHQPKSFDWRQRGAKLHPWKKVPDMVLAAACKLLNKIVVLTD